MSKLTEYDNETDIELNYINNLIMEHILKQKTNLSNLYRKVFVLLGMMLLMGIIFPEVSNAQGGLKINSFSDIESKVQEATTSTRNIVVYVIGACFLVALVFVIWAISRNDPHKVDYALGWFIAIIIYVIAINIV